MRVLLHHDRDPDCPLICFAQVVGRDPFMLVGRNPNPDFRFCDLRNLKIGVMSEVPTPWLTMQDDLARAGIDPESLRRGPERTMAENIAALETREIDVAQVMEPYAALAVAKGFGHRWHRFSVRGEIAFTTFYATREFVSQNPATCAALTKALRESVAKIYAMPAAAVAQAVSDWFPDVPVGELTDAIDGYQRAKLWTIDPSITPTHLVRLKAALLSGGLITRDIPYETVVDDRFAQEPE